MRRLIYICLIGLLLGPHAWAEGSRYASRSLLSEGRWVKIRVGKTGIYKLSYADLRDMGFPDPSKVSVHGYGGWPLEEDFSKEYIDDLPSTPVWRGKEYLLFYGKGPVKWAYDASSRTFVHTNNPYASHGYYFVTDATPTDEMTAAAQVSGATNRITTYDDYLVHEQELVSLAKSGRELYGEDFSGATPRTLSTFSSIPGITNEDAKVTMSFVSKVPSGTGVASLSINQSQVLDVSIRSNREEYVKALEGVGTAVWKGEKREKNSVVVSYNSAFHSNVRLNYVRLHFKRALRPYGAYTFFRSVASIGNVSRFVAQGANEHTLVFDVTDARRVKRMEAEWNGSELTFSIPAGALREFVLVQTDQEFASPEVVGEVENQNLHGLAQKEMIILAAKAFRTQAERLAEEHRATDGLTVEVVDPQSVYNEFSSGTPDATAYRRFLKMFYDRSASAGSAPKYLLLFGDGIYDNRGICPDVKNIARDHLLLTYQSRASLFEYSASFHPSEFSYVTDDYYGLLEDVSEEALTRTNSLCVGVGRFPVRTVAEAARMVDKVIGYMRNRDRGRWKNQITFVADDGNNADHYTSDHARQADELARFIEENQEAFLTNKVYFDAFKRDNSGTYPDVRNRIADLLKRGQLLINYTGHGNTTAWSDEYVWTQADIQQSAYPRLPVWVTATCDFTRFDDVNTSAGESVFLNAASGGIALFTTTRVVVSSANAALNKELYRDLFEREDKGRARTLGEALMATKRKLSGVNKLNFILIGDPALRISYPEYRARVTAVNGRAVSDEPFTFKALEKLTVEGEIVDPRGGRASDFTGILQATVLDSRAALTTLGNNTDEKGDTVRFSYTDYPNALYIGEDSVRRGTFRFSFTVPKDISYSNEPGKLNLYASDAVNGHEAQGSFLNYVVGGTADRAETDTIGPEIRQIYLNDSSFVAGGPVNATPYFAARLWDKSGVNLTGSSVGHDIMLTIDSMPSRSYNLNNDYALSPDREGEGLVRFSIPELEPGLHTAEFKVWDILNNSTTHTFAFEVVEGLRPNLVELYATPNPARDQVEFYLRHDRPETELRVTVMVYDRTGRLLWSTERSGSSEGFKAYVVTWNLTDNGGRRLRPGVYLYRAAIRANGSREATKANKLIILAQ
ncbi:type IX secretion system sortase PorU [Parabacteroides sp. ZJ-118]|uniref:type IX secretion system sortase PorU n=1 Tax=Parabacteroides sp. ZJ-118 TaxID=2709398 RepID=UPI0013EE2294|nr:type IX secretion system sortase PorU [Parabacteroides sp. ZJ-118]